MLCCLLCFFGYPSHPYERCYTDSLKLDHQAINQSSKQAIKHYLDETTYNGADQSKTAYKQTVRGT